MFFLLFTVAATVTDAASSGYQQLIKADINLLGSRGNPRNGGSFRCNAGALRFLQLRIIDRLVFGGCYRVSGE